MKNLAFCKVSFMIVSLWFTFTSCDNDDNPSVVDNAQAKAIAGVYKGYSLGTSKMFADYLLDPQSNVTVIANEDGTINLTYKSGAGDFKLNNLKVASRSFEGSGKVNISMSGGAGKEYDYTLKGNVDDSKVLTLKANLPAVMGGLDVTFMQGELPISYHVAATYQYRSKLSLTVMGKPQGETNEAKVIIKRTSEENTVDLEVLGFDKLAGGSMSMKNFTVKGVKVAAGESGSYKLSLDKFESKAGAIIINGEKLRGTVAADGIATITVDFKPGAMPMTIVANFTGSKNPKK